MRHQFKVIFTILCLLFSCSEGDEEIEFFVDKKSIKILFLGGSVTEGAGASSTNKRYTNLVIDQLRKIFPLKHIVGANRGVGSTPSVISCFLNDTFIEDFSPDLVFIDYSINDGNSDLFLESYEGLVRKIIQAGAIPIPLLLSRKNNTSARDIHLKIVDHYKLPIVDMNSVLIETSKNGKWSQFFIDDVHPNNNGHLLIASKILEVGLFNIVEYDEMNLNNDPLTENQFETTNYIAAESIDLSGSINVVLSENERFNIVLSGRGKSSINLLVEGENMALLFEKNPQNAQFVVTIDGIKYQVDAYANSSTPALRIWEDIGQGVHELKIETTKGGFELAGIGTM